MTAENQNQEMDRLRRRAARRFSEDPFHLGFYLSHYCAERNVTQAELALILGCDENAMTSLGVCRAPGVPGFEHRFEEDVELLSTEFQISKSQLADIINNARFFVSSQEGAKITFSIRKSYAIAAQDREEAGDGTISLSRPEDPPDAIESRR